MLKNYNPCCVSIDLKLGQCSGLWFSSSEYNLFLNIFSVFVVCFCMEVVILLLFFFSNYTHRNALRNLHIKNGKTWVHFSQSVA